MFFLYLIFSLCLIDFPNAFDDLTEAGQTNVAITLRELRTCFLIYDMPSIESSSSSIRTVRTFSKQTSCSYIITKSKATINKLEFKRQSSVVLEI